jgi:alkaline phosphatase D
MGPLQFPDGEIEGWACLGAVTERGVRVWLRDPSGSRHEARLRLHGQVAATVALTPSAAHDGIAAAELRLPAPAPAAPVTVEVAGYARQAVLAPAAGAPASLCFAFGSCHLPFARRPTGLVAHADVGIYSAMARVLRARGVRFLLLLGDQVYSDGLRGVRPRRALRRLLLAGRPLPPLPAVQAWYRRLYRGFFNQRGFRALLEGWPTYLMWDDHDIIDGWGSLLHVGPAERHLFAAASAAYREYQHLHNPGASLADAPPFDYQFWHGDIGFYVLDVRGARDYRAGVLLGEAQWRRFEAFLGEAAARGVATLFVAASIPVFHFPPVLVHALERLERPPGSDGRDRWSSTRLRGERDRLCERLLAWQAAAPARQVVLLSGDVHAGAAFVVRRPGTRGVLHQWTSSALTTPGWVGHHLANWLGTTAVNLGERDYRARCLRLELRNNFAVVAARPLTGGGHELTFALYGYDADRGALRPHRPVVVRPRGAG